MGLCSAYGLDDIVEVPGAVDDTVDLDDISAEDIKDKIGVERQDAVARFPKPRMLGNPAESRMNGEAADAPVDPLQKDGCAFRRVFEDPGVDASQIFHSRRKIPDDVLTCGRQSA